VLETILKAGIAAIPMVGGPMLVLYEGSQRRWATKFERTVQDIAGMIDLDDLANRLGQDPRLDALFMNAIDAATRTGLESKRRLLAKAVAQAALDDAKVDESELLAAVLREIEAPHVRALVRLRAVEDGYVIGESHGQLSDLVAAESQKEPEPVIAVLVHTGTAINGTFPGGSLAAVRVTAFGRHLLQELEGTQAPAEQG
jgi:hypothetical protein